jgi:hypothetical protein
MQRFDEPRFDEESQRRILARASQLQREESLSIAAGDLERAAVEAGIEPRHIRRAMDEAVQGLTTLPAPAVAHERLAAWIAFTVFLPVQSFFIYAIAGDYLREYHVPILATLFFGLAWSTTPSLRRKAVPALLAASGLVLLSRLLLAASAPGMYWGPSVGSQLPTVLALQTLAVLAFQGAALFIQRPSHRRRISARTEA